MRLDELERRHMARATPSRRAPPFTAAERDALTALAARIGHLHVDQRLGLEHDYEDQVFRRGSNFWQIENWRSFHAAIRTGLWTCGLLGRARRNARRIELRCNDVAIVRLPPALEGFTLLHLSDLHFDIGPGIVDAVIERVRGLNYDLCVLTGDYRARTYGPMDPALDGMRRLRPHLHGPAYGVLGNHDSIRMVAPLEEMGYSLLLNENVRVLRGGDPLWLAGIEDAHFYRLQNYHRAAEGIPRGAASVLLSHTPEAFRHAAHAGFSLMLSGHTHGGQLCLPGGRAILTEIKGPPWLVRGAWRWQGMAGYTSVGAGASLVDVRLNCPPEVTLHRLVPAAQ